jgi:CubicO group peptidase (beta-lactamase class C family)
LPDEVSAGLSEYLQGLVYHEGEDPTANAPGLVLLAITPDGRYLGAAGVANLADGTPIEVDDVLEIGSITKSFLAVLLLQLQEEGVLSLDDPLSRWLPDLAARIPNGEDMTLRQLAQHTAGLGDYEVPLFRVPLSQGDTSAIERHFAPGELVGWVIENTQPAFAPGEPGQWEYSNTGYILLGMALETATGQPLSQLLHGRILDPLGMESAVYLENAPEPGQVINGYSSLTGEYIDVRGWDASAAGAAGALAMNAEDLARYGQALAASQLFQEPDTLDEMLDFFEPPGPGPDGYGLGLVEYKEPGGWGHPGSTPGFSSLLFVMPDAGITIVSMANSDVGPVSHRDVLAILAGEAR